MKLDKKKANFIIICIVLSINSFKSFVFRNGTSFLQPNKNNPDRNWFVGKRFGHQYSLWEPANFPDKFSVKLNKHDS